MCTGGKSIREIYDGFNLNLIQKLPMKDATFIARLHQANLFGNGRLKSQVAAKDTQQDAATHFLNEAISLCIPNDDDDVDLDPLYRLLKAMEQYGGPANTLAKLAEKIKKAIPYTEGIYLFCGVTAVVRIASNRRVSNSLHNLY